jgi:alpha/beta superfamily hydrolase
VGFLEALYRPAPEAGAAAGRLGGAVILHPHPLYGGNMHSKVVYTCQKVCAEFGLATLRYNSRGVGASSGSYDDGQGEQKDVVAALDYLSQQLPAKNLYLVGFSFGAWLSLKVGAEHAKVAGMVALGTPVGWAELDFLARSEKPKLFIHGTNDQYCDPGELEGAFGRMAEPKRLHWVEGADHFFTERLGDLAGLLREHFPFPAD